MRVTSILMMVLKSASEAEVPLLRAPDFLPCRQHQLLQLTNVFPKVSSQCR